MAWKPFLDRWQRAIALVGLGLLTFGAQADYKPRPIQPGELRVVLVDTRAVTSDVPPFNDFLAVPANTRVEVLALPDERTLTKVRLPDGNSAYVASEGLFPPEELSPLPGQETYPLVRIRPTYPRAAARDGIEGFVEYEAVILPAGYLDKVRILRAEPPNVFEEAALKSLKQSRFRPYTLAEGARPTKLRNTIKFELAPE